MPHFTATEQVLTAIKALLVAAPSLDHVNHIGLSEDAMIFDYPAIILTSEPVRTEIHGTHQFKNYFRVAIFVYHAKLSENRDTRTTEDMELCTAIRTVLHNPANRQLGGGVIFGWISSVVPGTIRRPGNEFAIGSMMTWQGEGVEAFQ